MQAIESASARCRRKRRESGYGSHKRGLNTKIHLAVDANGMPIRILVTEGTRVDCKEAIELIKDISAEYLLADRGYDSDEIIEFAEENSMITVFHLARIEKNNDSMIKIYINYAIWWRTHF